MAASVDDSLILCRAFETKRFRAELLLLPRNGRYRPPKAAPPLFRTRARTPVPNSSARRGGGGGRAAPWFTSDRLHMRLQKQGGWCCWCWTWTGLAAYFPLLESPCFCERGSGEFERLSLDVRACATSPARPTTLHLRLQFAASSCRAPVAGLIADFQPDARTQHDDICGHLASTPLNPPIESLRLLLVWPAIWVTLARSQKASTLLCQVLLQAQGSLGRRSFMAKHGETWVENGLGPNINQPNSQSPSHLCS
ncbi:hypothetical protein B0T17DRAFT_510429 [Bombardia bombarda]|uniref:Uncharacterized protein n=1 Tax=Bombardia bombarda TaxID=252184 RepID=A0AA39WI92_9PEZI|nr:hypothetical protein B0T17DRAFT_510429 [Bombardia bombarda]